MAYGERYTGEFCDINGVVCTVTFSLSGYTGTSETVELYSPYVDIEAPETERFEVIQSKGCKIYLKQEKGEAFKYAEIFLGGEKTWLVDVTYSGVTVFRGYVMQELFEQDLVIRRTSVTIPCHDGLVLTEDKVYYATDFNKFESPWTIVQKVVDDIGLGLNYQVLNELRSEYQSVGDGANWMRRHYIDPYLIDGKTGKEILDTILRGSRIMQYRNLWRIERIWNIGATTKKLDSLNINTSLWSTSTTNTKIHTMLCDEPPVRYLEGSTLEFQPGYEKVVMTLNQLKLSNLYPANRELTQYIPYGVTASTLTQREIQVNNSLTYSWDAAQYDGWQSIYRFVGTFNNTNYNNAAVNFDGKTDGIWTTLDFTPEVPSLTGITGGNLVITWNYYISKAEIDAIKANIYPSSSQNFTVAFRWIVRIDDKVVSPKFVATYNVPYWWGNITPGEESIETSNSLIVNHYTLSYRHGHFDGLEVDRRYNYYKIPITLTLPYNEIITGYGSIGTKVANVTLAILKPCMGVPSDPLAEWKKDNDVNRPLQTTQVGEVEVTASQVVEEPNEITAFLGNGFSKSVETEMDIFTTENLNYANNVYYLSGATQTYLPVQVWNDTGTITGDLQDIHIKDLYAIYQKGRRYINAEVLSDNLIELPDVFKDANIATNNSTLTFYINSFSWNIRTTRYKLRLSEWEQAAVNLIV